MSTSIFFSPRNQSSSKPLSFLLPFRYYTNVSACDLLNIFLLSFDLFHSVESLRCFLVFFYSFRTIFDLNILPDETMIWIRTYFDPPIKPPVHCSVIRSLEPNLRINRQSNRGTTLYSSGLSISVPPRVPMRLSRAARLVHRFRRNYTIETRIPVPARVGSSDVLLPESSRTRATPVRVAKLTV